MSYQLEKSGQPEADTSCRSLSGFVVGLVKEVLAFITVGCVFMIFRLSWGNGIPPAKTGRGSLTAGMPVW